MNRQARPYPVLLAFLAFLAGVLAAGTAGVGCAVLVALGIPAVAAVLLRVRGVRFRRPTGPDRRLSLGGLHAPAGTWPVATLVALGALRLQAWAASCPPAPDIGLPPGTPVVVEARTTRIVRRDRVGTVLEVEPASLEAGSGRRDLPGGSRLAVRVRGYVDVALGATASFRGRLLPPEAPGDDLGPRWPRPGRGTTLAVPGAGDIVPLAGPGLPGPDRLDRVRAGLAARFRDALPPASADFALAVLLGEGGGIDPAVRQAMAVLGTAHVLSVSGLHVAAAAALVGLLVLRLLGPLLARRFQAVNLALLHGIVSSLAAWAVSALAGNCPPAQRSAAMFSLSATAAFAGRRQGLEAVIGLAGLASLLWDPSDAFSLSFLLSYAAMLGLAVLSGPVESALLPPRWLGEADRDLSRGQRWLRATARAACASIAATLATTPLTLLAFGSASLVAPVANLLVVPATTFVVMPVALLLVVLAPVPVLLAGAAVPASWVFDAFLGSQVWMARLAPGPGCVAGPVLFPAVLAASLAWTTWLVVRGVADPGGPPVRPRPVLASVVAGAVGAWAGWALGPVASPPPAGALVVHFLDVGKGDAALIRCPTGRVFLLDTGEARAVQGPRGLLAALRRQGVDSVDGVLLTHADEDHVGGTPALVEVLPVGEVAYPCPAGDEPPLSGILAGLRDRGLPTRCIVAGMDALPDCGARSEVLWPPPFRPLRRNAASLVVRLGWQGRRVLLTGDLEAEGEAELVASGRDVAAEVLKLGHHGSDGASTAAFLAAVHPRFTVATGYPSRVRRGMKWQTMERLAVARVRHLSTVLSGDLTLVAGVFDGENRLWIKPERLDPPRPTVPP